MNLGGGQANWMVVSIQVSVSDSNLANFCNFMLVLIMLSPITKNGKIVTNMAPFRPFRVILVIDGERNQWN